ncbi:MAG: WD40/YVTN/BNR-like repeat-containing protein [Limisphaerales bacterium]
MKLFKNLLLVLVAWRGANSAFAQTWTQTSASTNLNWGSVACSADGTKLAALASDIYGYYTSWVSTNSGATWTATSLPNTTDVIGKLLLSADGTKLVASDTAGFMYTSTDLGNTWISNTVPTGFLLPIALSADGTKMVAEGDTSTNDVIFTSTNSGTTWVSNNIPVNSALFGATSADGIRMVVTGMTIQGPSYVFTSTNSGATWSDGVPAGGNLLYSVAFSADGTKLVTGGEAPSETPFMLTSTNSGATWTSNSLPSLSAMWKSFALSADGNTLVAVATSVNLDLKLEGHILTSTNLGATWSLADAPVECWSGVACSADGCQLAASAFAEAAPPFSLGGIYTARTIPAPRLCLSPKSSNLQLSWIIPSTNFMMQQSADLQNWVDMTNQPVLNLTNLQNEVILPPPGSNVFYQLKTP